MIIRKLIQFAIAGVFACVILSCEKTLPVPGDTPVNEKAFIVYSCGHNNLSSSLLEDINDMAADAPLEVFPDQYSLVVFSHRIAGNDFSVPVDPILYQIYRNAKGRIIRDTLAIYPSKTYAPDGTPSEEGYTGADAKTLKTVLKDIQKLVPAREYNMLFSSHGTGWLPYNYYSTGVVTKTAGADYSGYGWTVGVPCEMDVKDYAKAIADSGIHLRAMLMDACFMGGAETAYELRNVCDYYVASQTEIWSDGLVYTSMLKNVFNADTEKGLNDLCTEYMANYRKKSKAATISAVKTSGLTRLAEVCRSYFLQYRSEIAGLNPSNVQVFRPTTSTTDWEKKTFFYDLRDVIYQALPIGASMTDIDRALEECILFKDATTTLFDGTKLRTHCGLTMYLPCAGNADLSEYYKGFMWNSATVLVK